MTERTYIMIKPDGVQRGLVGTIIARFEAKGYHLVGLKFVTPTRELLEEHYKDLSARPFFPALINYMLSGPVVATIWQGKNVVKAGRTLLGATNPLDSAPGTIRGDYSIDTGRNLIHGSDSVESANREIALWFKEEEQHKWESHSHAWIFE
jgi:nucleoside-diphosphate kinase